MKRWAKISLLVLLPAVLLMAGLFLWRTPLTEVGSRIHGTWRVSQFDRATGQSPVLTAHQTDSVLARFPRKKFEQLPQDWLRYTRNLEMSAQLAGRKFLVVRGTDRYRFVVRQFRVRDFLPKDSVWAACERCPDSTCVQYWLVEPKVLHKLTALLDSLDQRGLQADEVSVRNGYRHHAHNFESGGAKASRHRMGDAIDLVVGDVNGDGRDDDEDKSIVLTLLDRHIIRNEGGVGRYPGTQSVHMDVRGHRARWDSYVPARLSKQ